jgi:cob(I)alamin adenosyltransferase
VSAPDVPTTAPQRATKKVPSVVIVNTGDGKGKSTAAFGTMLRAAALGWKVCVIQFIKSGRWKVGEQKAATQLGVEWWSIGDGFTWDSKNMDRTEAVAREAWAIARQRLASTDFRLVILDEITYPITWRWIPVAEVVDAIRERPPSLNVIITGRDAAPDLIDLADTVTEMVNRKHAFDAGIRAMRGIDF